MTDTDLAPLGAVDNYADLAGQAYADRQSANERFQEARAASEAAALRELVFTAASYGVTRLMLEPSDQGPHMIVSEIEPEVDDEAEDYIGDAGSSDLSDYDTADWLSMAGVEQTEVNQRSEQIRKATIDVAVAAEAMLKTAPPERLGTTKLVGKTIASVTETEEHMRDTFGDEFTVGRTTINFTDNTFTSFGEVQMDLYRND